GERPVEWARDVLESRVRRTGGVTAHPYGLYLVQVEYRDEFPLPERYIGPFTICQPFAARSAGLPA
ncbi:tRNA pseudouridine synthase A, partial [Pseudomonas syringae pv. actinidiae ICMP 18804]